jgi:hypothetical protein
MNSKVPPGLANRIISVHFKDLTIDHAVRKIFEAQGMDYVFIWGRGIIVIALSQAPPAQTAYVPAPQAEVADSIPAPGNPVAPIQPQPATQAGQPQPAVIQMPFGTIPNPAAEAPPKPAGNNLLGNTSPPVFKNDPQIKSAP